MFFLIISNGTLEGPEHTCHNFSHRMSPSSLKDPKSVKTIYTLKIKNYPKRVGLTDFSQPTLHITESEELFLPQRG